MKSRLPKEPAFRDLGSLTPFRRPSGLPYRLAAAAVVAAAVVVSAAEAGEQQDPDDPFAASAIAAKQAAAAAIVAATAVVAATSVAAEQSVAIAAAEEQKQENPDTAVASETVVILCTPAGIIASAVGCSQIAHCYCLQSFFMLYSMRSGMSMFPAKSDQVSIMAKKCH